MRPLRSLPLLVLVVASALVAGCGPSSYVKAQRRELSKAMPGELEVTTPVEGDPRVAKVRIWVDEDFRAQNVRWRAQIEEQVDEANQFLAPALGLRLEIAELKPWPVRQADRTTEQLVEAIEAQDDGKDVTWVIGYTSSLSLAEARFEALGAARPLGRHLIVRGYADVEERKAYERLLPDTSAEERELVHQARRRHKQKLVLIHELGHSLGAPHERDDSWIMHGAYSPHMATLSDQSRALMRITLDAWLAPSPPDQRALAARLVGWIESNPWGGWEEDELREQVTFLHAVGDAAAAAGTDPGAPAGKDIPVPPGAYEQYKRAQALARGGKLDDALAELEALVSAYPASLEIRLGICEIRVGKHGPGAPEAIAACDRAAELSPADPRPLMARVQGHLARGETRAALPLLGTLEQRAGDDGKTWAQLAQIYQALSLVSRAELAIRRAFELDKTLDPEPIVAWAARTRARYGLPENGQRWKIGLDDEGEYVLLVRELLDLVYASKGAEMSAKAAAGEKRWKGAPGILAARCDLHLRAGEMGKARALCKQAVSAWPRAAWAQYLSGVIAFQDGNARAAATALRKAIEADPELAQAYRALGKALQVTGDKAGREALAAQYRARFGNELP